MADAKEDELLPVEVGFAVQTNNVRLWCNSLNHKKEILPLI